MEITSIKPLLAIGISLLAAFLILFSRNKPNLREFWSIAAGVIKFLIVISMVPAVLAGTKLQYTLYGTFIPGASISFKVDTFGLFFAIIASFLWILTTLYSIGYMRAHKEHAQTRYFACFALALSAVMGVAFAGNLLTMYLFYEILSFATYPLVGHAENPEALAGARKYVVYLLGTSKSFMLAAIVLTYIFAGTLEFSPAGVFTAATDPSILILIFILFIAGIAKGALMPFHTWLPSAMVAPTPVSALLHAVAVVKTGVFSILRIVFFVFGTDMLLNLGVRDISVYFVCFTIIVASIIALTKDNLKARLAYSTISQLSYIILGAFLLTPSGIAGGVLHIVVHAFSKITLFFTAGAIFIAHHKTKVSELNGIGRKMPFTMAAFAVGALSMVGLPPTSGFISKWYLFIGAVEADQMVVIIVLFASIILNATYFLPIVYVAFFKDLPPGETSKMEEAPAFMVVPLMITAAGAVALLFWPALFFDLAGMVAASVTGGN